MAWYNWEKKQKKKQTNKQKKKKKNAISCLQYFHKYTDHV